MYPTLTRIAGPANARHCAQNPARECGTVTVLCIPSSEGWFAGAPAPADEAVNLAGGSTSLAVCLSMRPGEFRHGARTALSTLSGGSQFLLVPEGQHDNSPTFQRCGRTVEGELVPTGRLKALTRTKIEMLPAPSLHLPLPRAANAIRAFCRCLFRPSSASPVSDHPFLSKA